MGAGDGKLKKLVKAFWRMEAGGALWALEQARKEGMARRSWILAGRYAQEMMALSAQAGDRELYAALEKGFGLYGRPGGEFFGAGMMRCAALAPGPEFLERMLALGGKPDARQPGAATPLMLCAHAGDLRKGKALLRRGADCLAADGDGWCALMYALSVGHWRFAQMLLQAGSWRRWGEAMAQDMAHFPGSAKFWGRLDGLAKALEQRWELSRAAGGAEGFCREGAKRL